jgi:Flp pilus assembly protein TadD
MSSLRLHHPLLAVAAAVLLSSCGAAPPPSSRDLTALDGVTSAIMGLPVTTASGDARNHFLEGEREIDLGRPFDALVHFKAAAAADSTMAIAYLGLANNGNSFAEFKTNLERAEHFASRASDAEQLQIQMARKGFENDLSGQLALAEQLVAKYPNSARAYEILGVTQQGLNRSAEARASAEKALSLAPRFLLAHVDLGNSYLFNEPRDFQKALQSFQAAEALAPNEPVMHQLLGSAQRGLNNLPAAAAEYTRAHELDPHEGLMLQQRGHVNSFLGDYAAARADYDSAMALGRGNQRAGFAPFRAYVSVYAGDPKAAIAELNDLVTKIDGMNMPEPRGSKINALTNVALIGIHTKDFYAADAALKQRTTLMREQSDQGGSAAFRRAQDANIAYFDGWLAARRGAYSDAQQAANRIETLLAPDANPLKLQPMHQLEGFIALYQEKWKDAATHFAAGNLLDPYIRYNYALALDGSGDKAKAKQIFQELAVYNFNSLGYALIRKETKQKAAAT